MAVKKSKAAEAAGTSSLRTIFTRGRWLIVAVLFIGVFAAGWHFAWNRVRDHVLADSDYQLKTEDIVITPAPPWIYANILSDVVTNASLEGSLSILDEELTKRLANAFSTHPWIAKVHRVSKQLPARVEVELTYRQPAAMVEVIDHNNAPALLPVDGEGTLLPTEDFSDSHASEAKRYLRIKGIQSSPARLTAGNNWGDVYVTGGAQIAKAIGDRWQKLGLLCVMSPSRNGAQEFDIYTYQLLTKSGRRIIWGRPPGNEPKGERAAAEKVAALEQLAASRPDGSLDGPANLEPIDIRSNEAGLSVRTATKPTIEGP